MPEKRPSNKRPPSSNMGSTLLPVDCETGCHSSHEKQHRKEPTGNGQLQCAGDAVTAGAPLSQARPKHHDGAAEECPRKSSGDTGTEPPPPERRHLLIGPVVA